MASLDAAASVDAAAPSDPSEAVQCASCRFRLGLMRNLRFLRLSEGEMLLSFLPEDLAALTNLFAHPDMEHRHFCCPRCNEPVAQSGELDQQMTLNLLVRSVLLAGRALDPARTWKSLYANESLLQRVPALDKARPVRLPFLRVELFVPMLATDASTEARLQSLLSGLRLFKLTSLLVRRARNAGLPNLLHDNSTYACAVLRPESSMSQPSEAFLSLLGDAPASLIDERNGREYRVLYAPLRSSIAGFGSVDTTAVIEEKYSRYFISNYLQGTKQAVSNLPGGRGCKKGASKTFLLHIGRMGSDMSTSDERPFPMTSLCLFRQSVVLFMMPQCELQYRAEDVLTLLVSMNAVGGMRLLFVMSAPGELFNLSSAADSGPNGGQGLSRKVPKQILWNTLPKDHELVPLLSKIARNNVLWLDVSPHQAKKQGLVALLSRNLLFSFPVLYGSLESAAMPRKFAYPVSERCDQSVLSVLWGLRTLHDSFSMLHSWELEAVVQERLDRYLREGSVDRESLSALSRCLSFDSGYFFVDQMREFRARESYLHPRREISSEDSDGCVLVRRPYWKVRWTPARLQFLPQTEIAQDCRMLRDIRDRFVCMVEFSGNVSEHITGDVEAMQFREILKDDGFCLGTVRFRYLLSSSSGLRGSKGYFIAGSAEDVWRVRRSFVPDPTVFPSTAKYMARLGLYATTDTPVCQIPLERTLMIEDELAADGSICTDGCGFLSPRLAPAIRRRLGLGGNPLSAVQFRYNGFKGMLVLFDHPKMEGDRYDLLCRPSMCKFRNSHTDFCVVEPAQYSPVKLNQQVLAILSSMAKRDSSWHLRRRVLELQQSDYDRLVSFFRQPESALSTLGRVMNGGFTAAVSRTFSDFTDPFLHRLLQRAYLNEALMMQKKLRVSVNDGCLLQGVSDPTGELGDGQIFVQVHVPLAPRAKVLVRRDVLLYRNPCLHPGDIRVVEAVDVPALRSLENVVVFPSRGCAMSVPAACSGGDLDGDSFAVIWDPDLVPPRRLLVPPLNYEALAKAGTPPRPAGPVDSDDNITEYVVRCLQNSSLGVISNSHLALTDQLSDGALNAVCCDLASAQSRAVDFPKLGVIPDVPTAVNAYFRLGKYPDFMAKPEFEHSSQLLGELYRCAKRWKLPLRSCNAKCDPALLLPGHEAFEAETIEICSDYSQELSRLVSSFNLNDEFELILFEGELYEQYRHKDRGEVSRGVQLALSALYSRYHKRFVQQAEGHRSSDASPDTLEARLVSSWYSVGYRQHALSFPWVLYSHLEALKRRSSPHPARGHELLSSLIDDSVKTWLESLEADVRRRADSVERSGRALSALLDREGSSDRPADVIPVGLSALGLDPSDLDAPQDPSAARLSFFCLGRTVNELSRSVESRPGWRVAPGCRSILVESLGSPPVALEVSLTGDAWQKTLFVGSQMAQEPSLYLVLRVFVEWGSRSGLIRSGGDDGSDLPTGLDFIVFVLWLLMPEQTSRMVVRGTDPITPFAPFAQCRDSLRRPGDDPSQTAGRAILNALSSVGRLNDIVRRGVAQHPSLSNVAVYSPLFLAEFLSSLRTAERSLWISHSLAETFFLRTSLASPIDLEEVLPKSVGDLVERDLAYFGRHWAALSGASVELAKDDASRAGISLKATGPHEVQQRMRRLLDQVMLPFSTISPLKLSLFCRERRDVPLHPLALYESKSLRYEEYLGACPNYYLAHTKHTLRSPTTADAGAEAFVNTALQIEEEVAGVGSPETSLEVSLGHYVLLGITNSPSCVWQLASLENALKYSHSFDRQQRAALLSFSETQDSTLLHQRAIHQLLTGSCREKAPIPLFYKRDLKRQATGGGSRRPAPPDLAVSTLDVHDCFFRPVSFDASGCQRHLSLLREALHRHGFAACASEDPLVQRAASRRWTCTLSRYGGPRVRLDFSDGFQRACVRLPRRRLWSRVLIGSTAEGPRQLDADLSLQVDTSQSAEEESFCKSLWSAPGYAPPLVYEQGVLSVSPDAREDRFIATLDKVVFHETQQVLRRRSDGGAIAVVLSGGPRFFCVNQTLFRTDYVVSLRLIVTSSSASPPPPPPRVLMELIRSLLQEVGGGLDSYPLPTHDARSCCGGQASAPPTHPHTHGGGRKDYQRP